MTYQNGVMPTDKWFEKVKIHVSFDGKSVVDYGCAEGEMCRLSKEAGAIKVTGIDHEHDPKHQGINFVNEKIGKLYNADIKIFSMIIHWIGKEEFLRHLDAKQIIVIYRTPSSGYIEQNGIFFPTQEELDKLIGVKPIYTELLMNQGEDKNIVLAIYDKASK